MTLNGLLFRSLKLKMSNQFNINIYSEDAEFCSSLAIECNKYGFDLTFFDSIDLENDKLQESCLVSVIIIDLTILHSVDPYKLGENARIKTGFPIFGVLEQFNRKKQNKARKSGFDLVFTKKMLLRSIKEVVVHIDDNND